MRKLIAIFVFIVLYALSSPIFAKNTKDSETYTFDMPNYARINVFSCDESQKAVGFVDESLTSLETDNVGFKITSPPTVFKDSGGFSRLVLGSYSGSSWQLTTARPMGLAVTYNTSGYIEADFLSLAGFHASNLSIYPSTIAFGVGRGAGVKGHIFKFYPIVRVSKGVTPDIYTGVVNFKLTVTSL